MPEQLLRRGRATFDAADSRAAFDFGERDLWRILVTCDGIPAAYREIADPGPTDPKLLTDAALRQAGELGIAGSRLRDELERRLGVRRAEPARPTCTVVLCTHQRPEFVRQAIAALARLDPPADEVVVVDSDPGEDDCQAATEAAGFRYVREDLRGQNRARAIGLRLATSEIVAYTDDDVIVSPGWLRPIAELFADPAVAGATGAAFGRRLDTRAQNLRESFAGFVPALARRSFDWTNLRTVSSGAAGAGASMMFRRQVLTRPPGRLCIRARWRDADRSAGDVYAMYRVLAAGHRIVFDPRIFAEHEHPAGDEALRRTVVGYGTGYSAFLTKALLGHRELEALHAWWWLPGQLLSAVAWERIYPQPGHLDLRSNYLRGGLRGALALVRSQRRERGRGIAVPVDRLSAGADRPRMPAGSTPSEDVAIISASGTAQRNRAVRESGEAILLFADLDLEASEDLTRSHAERHQVGGEPRIVIGYTETTPPGQPVGRPAPGPVVPRSSHRRPGRAASDVCRYDGRQLLPALALCSSVSVALMRSLSLTAACELALRALSVGIAADMSLRPRPLE